MKDDINLVFRLILFVLLLSSACHSGKELTGSKNNNSADNTISAVGLNKPNTSLVIATVIEIFSETENPVLNSPCSKAPCNAMIRVEDVLERGAGLPFNINAGQVLKAHFEYTLNPTNEGLFPGLKKYFPGLKINDKFKACLQERVELNNDTAQIFVYDYIKL